MSKILTSESFIIFIFCLILLPVQIQAQPVIPDHCFVNGEIDCARPECYHICYTPPTPGYESMPLAAPQSGLEDDTIEENAEQIIGRPRLSMPFHEEPLVLDTYKEEKKLEPLYRPIACPEKESVLLQIAREDLEAYQNLLKGAESHIGEFSYDKKDLIKNKLNYESRIDSLTYNIAASVCYTIDNKCLKYPNKEIEQKLLDYYDTIYSLRIQRERIYEYMVHCTSMNPDCLNSKSYSTISCDQEVVSYNSFNCIGFRSQLEDYEKTKVRRDEKLNKLQKMQCKP